MMTDIKDDEIIEYEEELRQFSKDNADVEEFKKDARKKEASKCISCSYCDRDCPTYALSRDISKGHKAKMFLTRNFDDKEIFEKEYIDNLYYCTMCKTPYNHCPNEINHENVLLGAREEVFKKAVSKDEYSSMKSAIISLEDPRKQNPFGKHYREKFNWLDKEDNIRADFLYFVGCADLLFNHQRVEKIMYLLDRFKIKYTISHEEQCCGHLARVLGRSKSATKLKHLNQEMVLRSKLKNIITACPHCYDELKRDFEHSDIKIWYITELLGNKIHSINSKQLRKKRMKVMYQDPCYLSERFLHKAPRKILQNLGCELIETKHSGDHTMCCGAGGGFYINHKEDSLKISKMRLDQAFDAGADAVVSDCPYCFSNFKKAKRKYSSSIKVYDIISMIAEAVKWTTTK